MLTQETKPCCPLFPLRPQPLDDPLQPEFASREAYEFCSATCHSDENETLYEYLRGYCYSSSRRNVRVDLENGTKIPASVVYFKGPYISSACEPQNSICARNYRDILFSLDFDVRDKKFLPSKGTMYLWYNADDYGDLSNALRLKGTLDEYGVFRYPRLKWTKFSSEGITHHERPVF